MKRLLFSALLLFTTEAKAVDYTILPTYRVATSGITVPALATDLACLEGTAGKQIRIWRIDVNGHAPTTAATASAQLHKRSTLNTGGTSTVFAGVPLNSNNAAPTLTFRAYTAVPATTGTEVGQLDEADALIQPSTSTTGGSPAIFEFKTGQPLFLNSATEALCISGSGTTTAFIGGSLEITVEWTE